MMTTIPSDRLAALLTVEAEALALAERLRGQDLVQRLAVALDLARGLPGAAERAGAVGVLPPSLDRCGFCGSSPMLAVCKAHPGDHWFDRATCVEGGLSRRDARYLEHFPAPAAPEEV